MMDPLFKAGRPAAIALAFLVAGPVASCAGWAGAASAADIMPHRVPTAHD